jgi:hypothetical protein
MTEFEQQVAEAMCNSSLVRGDSYLDVQACDECIRVAPRVAAAIEAAAAQTTVNIGLALGPGEIAQALERTPPARQWHEAALATLRSET